MIGVPSLNSGIGCLLEFQHRSPPPQKKKYILSWFTSYRQVNESCLATSVRTFFVGLNRSNRLWEIDSCRIKLLNKNVEFATMGSFQWQNRCTRSATTTTSKDSSAPPVCRKVTRRRHRRRRFQTWPSENLPSTSSFCRWSNQVCLLRSCWAFNQSTF